MSGGIACSKLGLTTVSQRDELGALGRWTGELRGTNFTETKTMRSRNHSFGAAIGLVCFWGAAQADVKDPLPDSLSLGGVTLYATIDVGYAYQSHGVPLSSEYVGRPRVPGVHDDPKLRRFAIDVRGERPRTIQDRHQSVRTHRRRFHADCENRHGFQSAVGPVGGRMQGARLEQQQAAGPADCECRQQPLRPGFQRRDLGWLQQPTLRGAHHRPSTVPAARRAGAI